MAVSAPSAADPEIAAAVFQAHLNALWDNGRPGRLGWRRLDIDRMHAVVTLPATRGSGQVDEYHFRLGGEYYDFAPPTVTLVQPPGWTIATEGSKWYPLFESKPSWFGLHSAYDYPDGSKRQLVCFSFAAEYYMTNHSPKDSERWEQGRHTVAATLYRLAEVLQPPYYRQPSA